MEEFFLTKAKVKTIIESLLFANENPMKIDDFMPILEMERGDIETAIEELTIEYIQRNCGIHIVKVAGGYQMCSSPENESWLKKMYRERSRQKLSMASLETLAIIAYKQPITRAEIEIIRGVGVDAVTKHLLILGLIKPGGRKEVIGRPFFYMTTKKFLEYFGLNSLKDLPRIEDFIGMAEANTAGGNSDNTVGVSTDSVENP